MTDHTLVAVVTGAAQGIGQAYAARLARDGFDIAIADLQPAEETEKIIREAGRRVTSAICDITSEKDVDRFAAHVRDLYGRCDVLINNAGIYPYTSFDDMTYTQWREVLNTDLDGTFLAGGDQTRRLI